MVLCTTIATALRQAATAAAPSSRALLLPALRAAAATTAARQYHSQPLPLAVQRNVRAANLAQKSQAQSARQQRNKAFYSTESQNGEPKPSKIYDFEAIQKLISSSPPSVTIIDSREPGELQQTGHIPGAINIPITSSPDSFHISEEEFEDRFGYPRPAKDAQVVFYCKAGVRSRAAAGLAKDAGWESVGEYPGSWLDWYEKGGKVER